MCRRRVPDNPRAVTRARRVSVHPVTALLARSIFASAAAVERPPRCRGVIYVLLVDSSPTPLTYVAPDGLRAEVGLIRVRHEGPLCRSDIGPPCLRLGQVFG